MITTMLRGRLSTTLLFLAAGFPYCIGWSFLGNDAPAQRHQSHTSSSSSRREALSKFIVVAPAAMLLVASTAVLLPSNASARNLPESTGADLTRTGTIETLVPIVQIKKTLLRATNKSSLNQQLFASIPTTEQDFKRIFDQYSDPVSYKQKFMDQNAFLVYYTQGFDGPNRPPMESSSDIPEKQTLQFGARNEAWVAWDDLVAELQFAATHPNDASPQELTTMLQATIKAVDNYLALAPPADLTEAMARAQ
mmetsp:Transcript_32014/g.52897  ORF Transcript_32014/g.52897 Transcript_32014/m.52897 type:complete len:251 (-) Transcript_32014:15-767(-)|eukprot:CAMPEP_0119003078 /NCGR_PEP_ID=MMETSP1176-20130426/341_1 /TAXON_ID=265551 /ORGANISM="Synedropsis recta cf, Strain CCMP1620" /LENGTH=250 /DNA_ID=CAMNT_0006954641 /DNA_START=26 /DNA_END=778 /DNA_ORIENTATION=-